MAVGIKKLIGMAEQIATHISISDDLDIVAGATAAHLKRFWDPRMLSQFVTEAEGSGVELSEEVAATIQKLKTNVAPAQS